MMKTNLLGALLALALVVAALSTAWLFFSYLQTSRQLQSLQTDVQIKSRDQTLAQQLLNEAVEYSKRDPTIEPLLQSMGYKVRTNSPQVSAKPSAK